MLYAHKYVDIESIKSRLSLSFVIKTIFLAFRYRAAVYPSICHNLWANLQISTTWKN